MSEGARIAAELRAAVGEGERLFAGIDEARTARHPSDRPGDGWCARDVIGHLLDSACNNHRRFVVNQAAPVLEVQGYDQNEWVRCGRYHDAAAAELVPLWAAYNRQIARVIEGMSDEVLTRGRGPMAGHSFPYRRLLKVASAMPSSAGEAAGPAMDQTPTGGTDVEDVTLRHLVEDYVGHIRHHLVQISSLLERSA